MKEILIYSDEGASPRSARYLKLSLVEHALHERYRIRRVTRYDLRTPEWCENAALLIFPGGRSTPYHDALAGNANRLIRTWVEQGGSYLGICAGAYYGCSTVEFEKNTPLEIIRTHELGFFQGTASGPAYGVGAFRYEDESGARIARLKRETINGPQEVASYFNGGCAFPNADQFKNVEVLARYQDIEDNPPAVITCQFGSGMALLSGVHPEYAPRYLDKNNPHLFQLREQLEKVDDGRHHLYSEILDKTLLARACQR